MPDAIDRALRAAAQLAVKEFHQRDHLDIGHASTAIDRALKYRELVEAAREMVNGSDWRSALDRLRAALPEDTP